MVTGQNDGAGASLSGSRLDLVSRLDALLLVDVAKSVGELIGTDGTDVGNVLGRKHVLTVRFVPKKTPTAAQRAAF